MRRVPGRSCPALGVVAGLGAGLSQALSNSSRRRAESTVMNEQQQDTTKPRRAGRRAGVRLQVRDIHILETLVERRCETLDYLHEHFFPGLSRKRALGRLRDLERAGVIHREG